MDINILYSYADTTDVYENIFLPAEIDFTDAGKLLQMQGRFCMAQFYNNYRKSENYLPNSINTIAIDIDDGLSVEEFEQLAQGYIYALGTTKSHQKPKHGKVCDRYRVIFPLQTYFNLSAYEYSITMREINRYFQADPACKDISRAFNGYVESEVYLHTGGDLLDWEVFFAKGIKRLVVEQWYRQAKVKAKFSWSVGISANASVCNDSKQDFFIYARKYFERRYAPGNRNNTVAGILLWGVSEGIDYTVLTDTLHRWVEGSQDPLPDRELWAMFRYHHPKKSPPKRAGREISF